MATVYHSTRKRDKIVFHGLSYRFDKTSGKDPALSFWRCDVDGCKARIHMKAGDVVQEKGEHLSHAPNLPKIDAAKAVYKMKVQAKETRDATRQILADIHEGLSQATVTSLPSKQSMTRTIQRVRQRNNLPALPATLAELKEIPADMKVLSDGTPFLAYDSGPGADRILIFATPDGLQLLFEQRNWFADGTFKVAPVFFTQIYSLHVLNMETTIPVVFALLPSKSFIVSSRLQNALTCTLLSHDHHCLKTLTDIGMTMLHPRTVLVTGANRGLGLELTRQLLTLPQAPDRVVAACRNPSQASELAALAASHPSVSLLKLDVSSDADVEAALTSVQKTLCGKGLNLLINNAGVNINRGGLGNVTRQELLTSFDSNTTGPILLTQKLLPLLKQAAGENADLPIGCNRAAVVNMSSSLASIEIATSGIGMMYPYRTSKAALNMATKIMADDFREDSILTISMHPGHVKTDMGGAHAPLSVEESISGILKTLSDLGERDSGLFYQHDGKTLPW